MTNWLRNRDAGLESVRYKAWLATLDAAEFENEFWTLRNERQFLDMSDDAVADRISWCETESHRRTCL